MSEVFHIITLGCRINQYESQALREAWQRLGKVESPDPEDAGLLLVNSCAVTARAVRDVRQTVRRLHRQAPGARIMVTGCAAALLREELMHMDGVCRVVAQEHKPLLRDPDAALPLAPCPPFTLYIADYQRARAVLKVQDGCSHRCTYCIVPHTRGPARSRPFLEVLEEARRLLQSGLRELVLSGVNLRQYRHDERDFWDLLAALDRELAPEWQGRARLRLSSLEPGQLDEKGLQTLAGCSMLCPHLHLSLQSGSPAVLERMGRAHYKPEKIVHAVEEVRRTFPLLGLGADLLTGFPAESEEEFLQTLELVQRLPLTYAHVFPYSRRPGTPAARLSHQVVSRLKTRRAAQLREIVEAKKQAFVHQLSSMPALQVLVETLDRGACGSDDLVAHGHCEFYVPVTMQGTVSCQALRRVVTARPYDIQEGRLLASIVPEGAGEHDAAKEPASERLP